MAFKIKRLLSGPFPIALLVILLLSSLQLISGATANSNLFDKLYSIILIINILSLFLFIVLIFRQMLLLRYRLKRKTAGARLTLRMIIMFTTLSALPLAVVYYFSLQFLNKGIDSWFDVEIEQALENALDLRKNASNSMMKTMQHQVELAAEELKKTPKASLTIQLDKLRRQMNAEELTLLSLKGKIISASSAEQTSLLPSLPEPEQLIGLGPGKNYVGVDVLHNKGRNVRVMIYISSASSETPNTHLSNTRLLPEPDKKLQNVYILHALFPISEREYLLSQHVHDAYTRYKELLFLRKPLKMSLTLTLSLVLLLALLASIWAAFYFTRRLTAPICNLSEGTQAVAKGNYDTRLPSQSNDDLGLLIDSFNQMTQHLSIARNKLKKSQQQAEQQHAYLDVILSSLSSGILSLDATQKIHTVNQKASEILGLDLSIYIHLSITSIIKPVPHLTSLIESIIQQIRDQNTHWREEITLLNPQGQQILMCQGNVLPESGYVIVFDDVTTLIQAQRNAAWGEVARRLAHEIKNPLTPIQLSAERLRQKYLPNLSGKEAERMDKLTHTIIQQVASMKDMVTAFSDYARMPKIQTMPINLNQLLTEVIELYRSHKDLIMHIDLTTSPTIIQADQGRLRQVFHNLIKNALDAMQNSDNKVLSITTQLLEQNAQIYVQITFKDTGSSIPPHILNNIFEPYISSKPKGNGLGLAIVKKIIEEHGGQIHAKNHPEGGAIFTVNIPLLQLSSH